MYNGIEFLDYSNDCPSRNWVSRKNNRFDCYLLPEIASGARLHGTGVYFLPWSMFRIAFTSGSGGKYGTLLVV